MASISLVELPKELLAHIASFTLPSSVLQLAQTCHTIRNACYDSVVFRNILLASQKNLWKDEGLDLDAIVTRAGNDVESWSRYAMADEKAWELAKRRYPLMSPKYFINFFPELFVVKHPYMKQTGWKHALRYRLDHKPSQVFCMAATVLAAADDDMGDLLKSCYMEGDASFRGDQGPKAFLWALCLIGITLRHNLRMRRTWPHNDSARVPHVAVPTLSQIPLQPLNDSYHLPMPFSRRGVELLGSSTTSFSNWDSWYRLHSYELFRSSSYLTDGEWCGYYIRFGLQVSHESPPMVNIHFRTTVPERPVETTPDTSDVLHICTGDCEDGLDSFVIQGSMHYTNDTVRFTAMQIYKHLEHAWDWECRLTPFGIVGFRGTRNAQTLSMTPLGLIWLWKKAWTEEAKRE